MTSNRIVPVILCGGAGTRLWPLSRRDHPKQFLSIGEGHSLLSQAIVRARLVSNEDVVLVAGEDHRFFALAAIEEAGVRGRILLEPSSRDTAAAIALAVVNVAEDDPDAVIIVMPSDHHIAYPAQFAERLRLAACEAVAHNAIALLGIRPTRPHAGYGYIAPGPLEAGSSASRRVLAFREKPDSEMAKQYVEEGFLWNAGIFVARASTLIEALEQHAPDILDTIRNAFQTRRDDQSFRRVDAEAYASVRKQSIDYAVMEQFDRRIVIPYEGSWSDLGSWNAVEDLFESDALGNRLIGDVLAIGCRDTLVMSQKRLGVVLGVENLAVIDTADAFVVAAKGELHRMKEVVEQLGSRPEAITPVRVERPWGAYEILSQGSGYQMKRITVKAGGVLSLQYHHHRSEHWIVIEGQADVTRDGETFRLAANESCFIPLGAVHRLANPNSTPLTLIEVQTGSYLGEDDIVRIEDVYGRNEPGSMMPEQRPVPEEADLSSRKVAGAR